MTNFAILDNENIVENIVVADDLAILTAFFPEKTIIEVSEETKVPYIGAPYAEGSGKFTPLKPFSSWVFDEENWMWKAPVDYPDGELRYMWDEETVSWVEIPAE